MNKIRVTPKKTLAMSAAGMWIGLAFNSTLFIIPSVIVACALIIVSPEVRSLF